ncbi:hypothetical protein CEH05_18085 [Halobacillus halophilus]|uniref:Uncharacterized protein n=1 Tax=Halobacillus halophilus (strain ATCC 35676 / DSM 2266 / JCM 20832 / KCTC 3685 / LMG 17431 / NBRC 102448 / NCIMB 2269) TaxID=866895 RepID=I0JSA1_HALH3|nr:hypothetical protein [Halobacillus halophilus]ASF40961.1 hypothetical protein CEH05_18085 [Halobacillus halophilus]CCG47022.1 hypothetical protein HBHAL_4684 [Halobacillus halophilus DSM 2266]
MKNLKQRINQWEAELKKYNLEPDVLQVFNAMSENLLSQKKHISELGDMLENSQQAYVELRKELVTEGYNLRY